MTDTELEPVPEDWNRALAIVAHPDDMEYGASAAVARWADQGKTITYLLVTRGEAGIDTIEPARCGELRGAEQRAACAAVGVRDLRWLDHPDGLVQPTIELRRDIAKVIRATQPELLLLSHYGDTWPQGAINHADHRAVGIAAIDAARDAANRWLFPDAGPSWSGLRYLAVAASPDARHAVDVTDHLDAGVASLQCHEVYLANLDPPPDPDSFLREMTAGAGPGLGVPHAVTFQMVPI